MTYILKKDIIIPAGTEVNHKYGDGDQITYCKPHHSFNVLGEFDEKNLDLKFIGELICPEDCVKNNPEYFEKSDNATN